MTPQQALQDEEVCIRLPGHIGITRKMGCGVISMKEGRGGAWMLLSVSCGLEFEDHGSLGYEGVEDLALFDVVC